MTDTVKTVATPMSRTSAKMGTLRRELKGLGFKQVILNQSKGKLFNNDLRGKVSKDYVEFFSIADETKQDLVKDNPNTNFIKTFGFNYNYLGREEADFTVEINYQEKVTTYDETEKKFRNDVKVRLVSQEISLDEFQQHLNTILNQMSKTGFKTPTEFLEFAIKTLNLQPAIK